MNWTMALLNLMNLAMLAGTAYLVGWRDWSPWWFLLTILLLSNYSVKRTHETQRGDGSKS